MWDALPSGLFLGGAPFNVSAHLNELDEEVYFVSRVGKDRLGKEAVRRIKGREISSALIQKDDDHETGFVEVELDQSGNPEYRIIEPVAWDLIEMSDELKEQANSAWGIVFGSLAQRSISSRETIRQLLEMPGKKIFDINLRSPHFSREVVEHSIKAADVVKLNEDELAYLKEWFELSSDHADAIKELCHHYSCETVCVTKGGSGAEMLHRGQWASHPGYKVEVADLVGAGDAFFASLISGIRQELGPDELLRRANATGAFVASRAGALPHYDMSDIQQISKQNPFDKG